MMRRAVVTCLVCIAAQCWLHVARAQYFPALHPTERRAVADDQNLLVDWHSSVVKSIGADLNCDFWYIFRADVNARRMFAVYEGEDPEKCYNSDVTEYEVVSELPGSAATDYLIDGQPLYIGVGRYSNGQVGSELMEWDVLCAFAKAEDGAPQLIDLIAAQRKFITDLYALDLTNDGLLDVACVSSWGVSSGGGIDFVTLEPDGTFRQFWPSEAGSRWLDYPPIIESTIESAYSVCSIHDFNADGIWEIETQQYLDYGGGMGSYTYNVLYTFDPQAGTSYACTDEYPGLFAGQRTFYEAFAQALTACEENPEPFKRQTGDYEQLMWEHNGKDYLISGFEVDPDEILQLLESWDDYQQSP